MKALLAALAIVLGAMSAWFWLGDRPSPAPADPAQSAAGLPEAAGVPDAGALQPDAEIEAELAEIPLPASLPDSAGQRESRRGRTDPALERRLAQNTGYVERRRELVRLTMSGRYPDIARVLELSPETAERLLDVLADHRARYARPFENRTADRPTSSPGELELARQEREFALETSVMQTIGQARMARYEAYMGSLYERYEIKGLQFELMNLPDPLEFEDAERVIRAMYEERQEIERELTGIHGVADENDSYPPAFVVDGEQVAGLAAGTNERILAAATRHLSPAQAEYFRRSLDDVDKLNRLSEEIRRIRKDAKLDGD